MPANLTVNWEELGLDVAQRMAVRDVTNRRDLPDAVKHFKVLVGKHDVSFVRLIPYTNTAIDRLPL